MLSEISQSQKDKYCVIPLIQYLEESKSQTQKKNGGCQGLRQGERNEEFLLNWHRVPILHMKRVMDDDGGGTTL